VGGGTPASSRAARRSRAKSQPAVRAVRAVPVDGASGLGALAREEALHRPPQPGIREEMGAPGPGRVEPAQLLVSAARARLEAFEPVLDAVRDAGVVADVEV